MRTAFAAKPKSCQSEAEKKKAQCWGRVGRSPLTPSYRYRGGHDKQQACWETLAWERSWLPIQLPGPAVGSLGRALHVSQLQDSGSRSGGVGPHFAGIPVSDEERRAEMETELFASRL